MMIPAVDLKRQHQSLGPELHEALRRVIDNSSFIQGPEVAAFEEAFARYIGVRHAIGVASGTAALQVSLLALGIRPGDEVIVPAMTFFATAEVVALLGATPVFADIDPHTCTIDPADMERKVTQRTRAVMPVHLHGHPADLPALMELTRQHNLAVVEDCAHSTGSSLNGAMTGSMGTLGAFSFYPTKNLGAIGDAGLITTNEETLARLCREYRDHGSVEKFRHNRVGTNSRLDGLQAAVLSAKLPYLDGWNQRRRQVAAQYERLLSDVAGLRLPSAAAGAYHVFHVYQLRTDDRDRLAAALQRQGVGVNLHYPVPMHLHPGFAHLGYRPGDFPNAERLASTTLSLPCYPELSDEEVGYVAIAVKAHLGTTPAATPPYADACPTPALRPAEPRGSA